MKIQRFRMAAVVSGLLLLATGVGIAQDRPPRPPHGGPDGGFVAAEMRFGTTVKGAPYSAEVITESTQTLSDGTKINRQTKGAVYRDSEGRTRKEDTFNGVGPFAANGGPMQMVFVNDPVAGASYRIDPATRSVTKVTIPARRTPSASAGAGQNMRPEDPSHRMDSSNRTVEQLGTQTIEGVEAEGTRTTFTIAAGAIGNEKAIQVVSERWYSPALQVVVLNKHSDPRQGDHVYRLTNINRNEPAASLFTVPTDYAVRDATVGRPGPGGRGRIFIPPSRPNNNQD
jgi:hypothetical protein